MTPETDGERLTRVETQVETLVSATGVERLPERMSVAEHQLGDHDQRLVRQDAELEDFKREVRTEKGSNKVAFYALLTGIMAPLIGLVGLLIVTFSK